MAHLAHTTKPPYVLDATVSVKTQLINDIT